MHYYTVRKYQTVERVVETVVRSHRKLESNEVIDFATNIAKEEGVEIMSDRQIDTFDNVTSEEYGIKPWE